MSNITAPNYRSYSPTFCSPVSLLGILQPPSALIAHPCPTMKAINRSCRRCNIITVKGNRSVVPKVLVVCFTSRSPMHKRYWKSQVYWARFNSFVRSDYLKKRRNWCVHMLQRSRILSQTLVGVMIEAHDKPLKLS
jgi:hypothetical protein